MYKIKDLQDPNLLFDRRLKLMRDRIQVLLNDYQSVNHYFSKAIIEVELEKLVDEYLERSFILQRQQSGQSEKTTEWNWMVKNGFKNYARQSL